MFKLVVYMVFFMISISCNCHEDPLLNEFNRLGEEIAKKNDKLHLTQKRMCSKDIGDDLGVGFVYITDANVTVDDVRLLLLSLYNFCNHDFNNNKDRLKSFVNYPVTWSVTIRFYYPDLRRMMDPELAGGWMMNGEIRYQTNEMGEDGYVHLKTLFTETYEEAAERAKEYKGPKPF